MLVAVRVESKSRIIFVEEEDEGVDGEVDEVVALRRMCESDFEGTVGGGGSAGDGGDETMFRVDFFLVVREIEE